MTKENADFSKAQLDRARLVEALSELYHLLENYAPTWYTQAHHKKAEDALHATNSGDNAKKKLKDRPTIIHPNNGCATKCSGTSISARKTSFGL